MTSGSRIRTASQPSPVSELIEPPLARHLVGPRRAGRPGREVAHRGVLDLGRLDAPRQQVVAVDDDVVGAGVDRVDDRQLGRPVVEERLGVALAGLVRRAPRGRSSSSARPMRPDRSEGRVEEVAGARPVVLRCVDRRRASIRAPATWPLTGRRRVDRREVVGRGVADQPGRLVAQVPLEIATEVAPALGSWSMASLLARSSASRPDGRAFLGEGGHPLGLVLGSEERKKASRSLGQAVGQARSSAARMAALAARTASGGMRGDACLRARARRRRVASAGTTLRHQAARLGLAGAHRSARSGSAPSPAPCRSPGSAAASRRRRA